MTFYANAESRVNVGRQSRVAEGIIEKSGFVRFTVIAEGVWRGGALPARNCGTYGNIGITLSVCSVHSVDCAILAALAENRAKIGVFSGNAGNLPQLRAFLEDMLFVESRFCGNEAILGGL